MTLCYLQNLSEMTVQVSNNNSMIKKISLIIKNKIVKTICSIF